MSLRFWRRDTSLIRWLTKFTSTSLSGISLLSIHCLTAALSFQDSRKRLRKLSTYFVTSQLPASLIDQLFAKASSKCQALKIFIWSNTHMVFSFLKNESKKCIIFNYQNWAKTSQTHPRKSQLQRYLSNQFSEVTIERAKNWMPNKVMKVIMLWYQ